MKIEQYLSDVFSENVTLRKLENLNLIPMLIRNEYEIYEGNLNGYNCLFLEFHAKQIITEKILKHFVNLGENFDKKLVLLFSELRPYQRRSLVENRIPFIVPYRQIYLPFVYVDFSEKIALNKPTIKHFTPSIQSVYLAIFYQETEIIDVNDLTKKLGLAKITIYRAISSLVAINLVHEQGKSTRKQFTRINKESFWNEGKKYLVSPIQKSILLKTLPVGIDYFISNESALSELSMVSTPQSITYAISKESAKKMDKGILYSEKDEHYDTKIKSKFTFEIWSYDPKLFASNKRVDIGSIYAELKNLDDPRIDIELETLLER